MQTPGTIILPIKEANLLRGRLRLLLSLRQAFLEGTGKDTIHDLRVASRRVREVLDYLQPSVPARRYGRLRDLARRITRNLGSTRETEVNIAHLQKWNEEKLLDPVAVELLVHSQRLQFQKSNSKALKRISEKKFLQFERFFMRIRGSLKTQPTGSTILEKRSEDFLSFPWSSNVDDQRLHDLRIRTKKFRYSVEIYDRLHQRNLGRFLRRIKILQEVLGEFHDLFVLGEMIRRTLDEWQGADLTIIPSVLKETYEKVLQEKIRLQPRVYPLYSNVIKAMPAQLTRPQTAVCPLSV